MNSKFIPQMPANNTNSAELDAFLAKDTAFIDGAKNEYCYYK